MTGPITGEFGEQIFKKGVIITNNNSTESAIKLENEKNVYIRIGSEDGYSITLDSAGGGIRVQNSSKGGTVTLDSGLDNIIKFAGGGNGIEANSDISISLNADRNNIIESSGSDTGEDGITIGDEQKADVKLVAGENNYILVRQDGIFTANKSTNGTLLQADNGNNFIVSGNNGIDHRGQGTVTLSAENGANIINAGIFKKTQDDKGNTGNQGDGIRIQGAGGVELTGKYNFVKGFDEGLYVHKDATNEIKLTADNADKNGYGNYVIGEDNAVQVDGAGKVTILSSAGANLILSKNNAVYNNATGNISVYATKNNNGIETVSEDGASDTNNIKLDNYLIGNENGLKTDNTGGNDIKADHNNIIVGMQNGILSNGAGTITVTAGNNNIIGEYTIQTETGENITLASQNGIIATKGDVDISAAGNNVITAKAYGIGADANSSEVDIDIVGATNTITSYGYTEDAAGIYAMNGADLKIEAKDTDGKGIGNRILSAQDGIVVENAKLNLVGNTYVDGIRNGIIVDGTNAYNAQNTVTVNGDLTALSYAGHSVNLKNNASMHVTGKEIINNTMLIETGGNKQIDGSLSTSKVVGMPDKEEDSAKITDVVILKENTKLAVGENVYIQGTGTAIDVNGNSSVTINQNDNNLDNYIEGAVDTLTGSDDKNAIKAIDKSSVQINGSKNTIVAGGKLINNEYHYTNIAVNAQSGSTVTLNASGINQIGGAVYANGSGTDAEGKDVPASVTLNAAENNVYSAAVIEGAGGLEGKKITTDTETGETVTTGLDVVSALYAENGAQINVSGMNNFSTYYSDPKDTYTSERVVWAYDRADINIDGYTNISTTLYNESPNSKDIAVAAGTATDLRPEKVNAAVSDRATVTLTYDNYTDEKGNEYTSNIEGDILSAYEGLVNIAAKEGSNAGINITGNLLAGNNGILNVDIGKGGKLIGRADDYGDAGVVQSNEHQEFYNPAFSSTIYKGGRVDLGMGAGSKWYVTGQSWITTIDTSEANGNTPEERATIDLVTEYKDKDGGDIAAHALTVYDFKGDADFLMNLSGNRADTDMLYMKHADGDYRIMLDKDITSADINQDKEGNEYSGLRFATVGADSKVTFSVGSYDNGGAFNVEYEVGQDEYGGAETAHENEAYNGTELNGGKPGDNMVDNFFGSEGEPVTDESANGGGISTASANGIMLMNEEVETFADEENNANKYNAINHKIIAIKDTELNDTGETILNMSRANYSNAIYMDRLNKRLGESRYINDDPEEDEGMWVRIRHDRIGKDDAYRSQNTMYELGYDKKQDCDNGERRVGFAVDYMHGDTGYSDIAGKGEIDRYGLWLYDTWMGDKCHYVDYVAKWGHLDNDFEVYTMRNGDKVTGDYSNNVFSVSAEYGRKKDIGNDWYFEPQAQLQLARVTGADYTTNQGTKVSVDGINSLIGRAGFRIGKDFGEEKQSTLYFKADVLHEFLGDQDVYVMDKSTDNKWAGISYDNEGTWYDIGIGYAAMMSKSSYAFIDLEQSFGNDNDDTYQINAGVQWTF